MPTIKLPITSVAVGAAAAWCASRVESSFSPLLLFPIIVGCVVGLSVARIASWLEMHGRRLVLWCAVVAGLTAAVGQHYATYQQYRREYMQTPRDPKWQLVEALRPELGVPSFAGYLRAQATVGRAWIGGRWQGSWAWTSWAIDAALLVTAAAVTANGLAGRIRQLGKADVP